MHKSMPKPMINVHFFGRLRDTLKCERIEIPAPENVAQLRIALGEKFSKWQDLLQQNQALVAVNQTMSDEHKALQRGDEVAFFPPVTGG